MLTIGVELIMLPPVPLIEPSLPFGVLDLTGSTTAPAVAASAPAPRAEKPEQAEEQEREEDEAGEVVPVVLDHDRLPIGRRHHFRPGVPIPRPTVPVPVREITADPD